MTATKSTDVLEHEHQKGESLLAQLDDAAQTVIASGAGKDALVATLRDLVRLHVDHIWKENYLLLPMADKVLSKDDRATLRQQFNSVEAELGAGKHQHLEQLSMRLELAL